MNFVNLCFSFFNVIGNIKWTMLGNIVLNLFLPRIFTYFEIHFEVLFTYIYSITEFIASKTSYFIAFLNMLTPSLLSGVPEYNETC